MARHREAMECRNCEEVLYSGIEAYEWLSQADRVMREAAREGLGVSEKAVKALALLFRHWLDTCETALELIKEQEARGFDVKHAQEFLDAYRSVQIEVQKLDDCEALEDVMNGTAFDSAFWEEAAQLRSRHTS